MPRPSPGIVLIALLCLCAGAIVAAVMVGSAGFPWSASAELRTVVLELRLPRALTAFSVGGLLALAGVLMQVLLRNPLAEPYILGSSGGAAVAALLLIGSGASAVLIDTAAFFGSLGATLLVFLVARQAGRLAPTRLLLTGIVLAAGFGAVTTLILALSPEQHLRGMLFWLMGDLSFSYEPVDTLVLLALLTALATLLARHLNVLAAGETQAAIVGMSVQPARYAILAAASLATAYAVTTAGVIGFVGLVVPHLMRLIAGSNHRIVVPASVLGGGLLLVVADTLSRTLMAPRQLPVGALTAAIGVPMFLYLMRRVRAYQ